MSSHEAAISKRNLVVAALLAPPLLLGIDSVGHAETITKVEVACIHRETLERVDQLASLPGRQALDFMKNQFSSGECSSLNIGASVRVDKRTVTEVCVSPSGSSEPCRWTSSAVVK